MELEIKYPNRHTLLNEMAQSFLMHFTEQMRGIPPTDSLEYGAVLQFLRAMATRAIEALEKEQRRCKRLQVDPTALDPLIRQYWSHVEDIDRRLHASHQEIEDRILELHHHVT